MQKVVLPISKCIPGMVTAQPIVDLKTGVTIIGQNQVLTEDFLKNIPNFVYNDIWVYLNSFDKVWELSDETIQVYKEYSNALMYILENMGTDHEASINLDHFNSLCNNIPIDFNSSHALLGCTNLIAQLDYSTYTHSLNVAFISLLICKWCHLDESLCELAVKAGLLHDVGMLNLSFSNGSNPATLSETERIEYEKHPIFSYNITRKMKDLDPAIAKAILAHHEYCDGSGFPLKLTSAYISKLSKIIGLADTYENLRYHHHIFDTLQILLQDSITKFDTELLFTFCHTIANYYIGVFATLSNGEVGEVVFINPNCVYRPVVKINERYINLYETPDLTITEIN